MNRFVSGAAAKNLLRIFGEGEAVKGLVDAGPRNQGAAGDFDDGDFMPSITAVQNGGKFSLRMHRDVHGEIAQHDLFADRAEEPLVGQPHRAIGLLARHFGVSPLCLALDRSTGRQHEDAEEGKPGNKVSHKTQMPSTSFCIASCWCVMDSTSLNWVRQRSRLWPGRWTRK